MYLQKVNFLAVTLSLVCACTPQSKNQTINDVTTLNPIQVEKVIVPQSVEEIASAVKAHQGPVSISGGRFSMGGQIAKENSLHIDMRELNQVLQVDTKKRTVAVQAGATWRDIQEVIDPLGLSIKIMQSYANFTVGGSLSVNAHGRYVGEGPLVRSVVSIKLVLADGSLVTASSTENSDIFWSAIGGYGGIGVITEATLQLAENEKIKKRIEIIPTQAYREHFIKNIKDNKSAVLHNGDMLPPSYNQIKSETWLRTDEELTRSERLVPRGQKYWLEPNVISGLSTIPFGGELRTSVIEPLLNSDEAVLWRNYEASYDVAQLEPTTPRILFTYVLQEYFVPVARFDEFVPKMREILQKHDVNVINISVRHALPDPGTFLAWADEEVFSFVIYYKQSTLPSEQKRVGQWTRELIDAALSSGGRYYLPYQIHGTQEQFQKAYPGFQQFLKVKKRVDPTNKFQNRLWSKYLDKEPY